MEVVVNRIKCFSLKVLRDANHVSHFIDLGSRSARRVEPCHALGKALPNFMVKRIILTLGVLKARRRAKIYKRNDTKRWKGKEGKRSVKQGESPLEQAVRGEY
ncbi:hypothetical protein RRG08_030860 [Elysia crispata]|uniref:Uncharacterized protein n=1 Tax=Elysia crispata TaxID=231223 RepID=A0AAE1CLG3_9GAST|nr:hypothetical protein RRG08_030860 [Elysia crispata]